MPLPLFWLGAAAVSALTVNELSKDRKKQQLERFSRHTKKFVEGDKNSSTAIYPSDVFSTSQKVRPEVGAIVCCGIGGLLDHTGIWVGDNTIIEMDGNGLIKPVSVQRFTEDRTGKNIFVACDSNARCLAIETAAIRASKKIFQCEEYDMFSNNCHQFVWQCFKPNDSQLTTFKELNKRIAKYFKRQIYWDLCDIDGV